MKNKKLIYWVWILVMSSLFYQQSWGLNTLVFVIFSLLIFIPEKLNELKEENLKLHQSPFFMMSILWLLSAFSVFWNGGIVQGILFFMVSVSFLATRKENQIALFYNWMQLTISGIIGWYFYFTDIGESLNNPNTNNKFKLIKVGILSITGLILLISFFKIYQAADENFYQMTSFINLSWISWGFIGLTLFLSWFLYGTFFFKLNHDFAQFQTKFQNKIDLNYSDKIQTFLDIKFEKTFADTVMLFLIALLGVYLFIDIQYLSNSYGIAKEGESYSSAIHSGIGAVIFSIVMVIGVITFFFRGQLNFVNQSKSKWIATGWLLLNVVLIATTAMKNFDYVNQLGLTYLRLGVFLYLILCIVGITFCLIKIHGNLSFWYLLRKTTVAFLCVFVMSTMFNWNKTITNYNLNYAKNENPDLYYLYYLGPESYGMLLNYMIENNIQDHYLFDNLVSDISRLQNSGWLKCDSWPSFNYRDYQLLKEFNQFNFITETEYSDRSTNNRGL